MKNAIIFHGTGNNPNSTWHPYIKAELEKLGYQVNVPQLPNAENPKIETWLNFALKECHFDQETVLIGHSAGVPLILSILENIDITIHKAILVSGFVTYENTQPILQNIYN